MILLWKWIEYYHYYSFRVKNGVKVFYSRLLNPDISQGASDYYVIMLIFDVLCLITIVFGVSSFGVSNACLFMSFSIIFCSVWGLQLDNQFHKNVYSIYSEVLCMQIE